MLGISQLKWQWFRDDAHNLIDMEDFDAASRDAWNSLLFLFKPDRDDRVRSWHAPWRSFVSVFRPRSRLVKIFSNDCRVLLTYYRNLRKHLAKFAALLAVLAFITDPFTQQILDYESCAQKDTGLIAKLSRTNGYTKRGGAFTQRDFVIDAPMSVAINRGTVDPPADPATLVTSDCKSGNCTFAPFSTVALCHSCREVTNEIQNNTRYSANGLRYTNFTLALPNTPSGRAQMLSIGGNNPDLEDFRIIQVAMSFNGPAIAPVSIAILMSGPLINVTESPWIPSVSAFNCSLAPCVRSYNSSITNSTLAEQQLSHEYIGQNQLITGGLLNNPVDTAFILAKTSTWRNGRLESCDARDQEAPGFTKVAAANIGAAPDTIPSNRNYAEIAQRWVPNDCVYTFGLPSLRAISSELSKTLDDIDLVQPVVRGLQFPRHQPTVASGPIAATNMWLNGTANLTTMNAYMAGLTDVMTATIRKQGSSGPDEWQVGQEWRQATCVRVRWAWFAYPVVLVGLAIAFLLVLILQSPGGVAHRGWKSSSLAVLFAGVDGGIGARMGGEMGREEMMGLARGVRARLVVDGGGRGVFVEG